MAVQALIGTDFTFQALFRDSDGTPLAVNVPTISVFYYDDTGTRQDEVAAAAMSNPTPAETGRYVYAYSVPTTFEHGSTLYAEMTGTHPGTGDTLEVKEALLLLSGSNFTSGFTTSFIS